MVTRGAQLLSIRFRIWPLFAPELKIGCSQVELTNDQFLLGKRSKLATGLSHLHGLV